MSSLSASATVPLTTAVVLNAIKKASKEALKQAALKLFEDRTPAELGSFTAAQLRTQIGAALEAVPVAELPGQLATLAAALGIAVPASQSDPPNGQSSAAAVNSPVRPVGSKRPRPGGAPSCGS
jgi:hypothetical protein